MVRARETLEMPVHLTVSANISLRWLCIFAEYTYPHVDTPIFIQNSMYDSWQTGCILAAEPVNVDSSQNGSACSQHRILEVMN